MRAGLRAAPLQPPDRSWITGSDLLSVPQPSLPPSLQQTPSLFSGRSERAMPRPTRSCRSRRGAADAPTGGASASGSAALLGLFIQVQQTHKMKVRPRSVLLRKSPSLFLRKRKTNIFLSLRRRGGVSAWILLGARGLCTVLLQQAQDWCLKSPCMRQLQLIFLSLDLSWS